MSLQVWLPLINDLKNYGVSSLQTASVQSGVASSNDGKIGKCYKNSGTNANVTTNINITIKQFSMSAWVRIDTLQSNWCRSWGLIGDDSLYIGFGCEHSNGTALGFHYCKTFDGTNTTIFDYYPVGPEVGSWVHYAVTYDGTNYYMYKNGVLIRSAAVNKQNVTSTLTGLKLFGGYGSYCAKHSLNDVRLYDHCLSPKEVKEISKALVCHYPLDNNGIGNINYFKNSNFYSSTTTDWYSVNGSSIRVETKDRRKCITGTKGTSSNICGQTNTSYSYVGGSQVTFTISADVYVEETGTFGVGNWITTTQASGWQGMSGSQRWNTTNVLSIGWNHISVTRINGTNQYNGNIVTAFSYTGTTYWITNAKFEFGDKDTPWCPHTSDAIYSTFNPISSTEYDTSGYKNNGTRNAIDVVLDSPRYSCSSKFNGTSSYINIGRGGMVTDEITLNLWGHMNDWITPVTQNTKIYRIISCAEGGGWSFRPDDDKTRYRMSVGVGTSSNSYIHAYMPLLNLTSGWHMLSLTYNGLRSRIYLDGIFITEAGSLTTKTPIFYHTSNNIYIGTEATASSYDASGCFPGNISDVRIYATALSDADILELYNTGASIDNGGNILTGDIVETSGLIKPTIEKNTIIQNNEFDESEAMDLVQNKVNMSYVPAKDTNNSTINSMYAEFDTSQYTTSDVFRVIADVSFSGFDSSSTAGTFSMNWQGDVYNPTTSAWEWVGSNTITPALNNQKALTTLVLSATSGSYRYDTTFTLNSTFLSTYSRARIGVRANYSNGVGRFTINKIIVIHDKYSSTSLTKAHMGKDFMAGASFIEK